MAWNVLVSLVHCQHFIYQYLCIFLDSSDVECFIRNSLLPVGVVFIVVLFKTTF